MLPTPKHNWVTITNLYTFTNHFLQAAQMPFQTRNAIGQQNRIPSSPFTWRQGHSLLAFSRQPSLKSKKKDEPFLDSGDRFNTFQASGECSALHVRALVRSLLAECPRPLLCWHWCLGASQDVVSAVAFAAWWCIPASVWFIILINLSILWWRIYSIHLQWTSSERFAPCESNPGICSPKRQSTWLFPPSPWLLLQSKYLPTKCFRVFNVPPLRFPFVNPLANSLVPLWFIRRSKAFLPPWVSSTELQVQLHLVACWPSFLKSTDSAGNSVEPLISKMLSWTMQTMPMHQESSCLTAIK